MPDDLEMYGEFSNLISNNEKITGNAVVKILKKYASSISVFDMMAFSSQIIEENKYVTESYREDSQKSYIESFLFRVMDISKDNRNYEKNIDKNAFSDAVALLKTHYENGVENSKPKVLLIFEIASIYATFILENPIHPVGTPMPGSLKVKEEKEKFFCPAKNTNNEMPNAVCNICLAEQIEF